MPRIACIVEGHGDGLSVPVILRRVAEREGVFDLRVMGPFRIPKSTLLRPGELERAVERAARSLGGFGGVLVLLDADHDVACRTGPALAARAANARPDLPTGVVVANREKEAWYIAAIFSLRGRRGVPADATPPGQPEAIRGAKEWLSKVMGRPYSEIADQRAFSHLFDLDLARAGAASFDKFWRDARRLLLWPPQARSGAPAPID